MKIYKYDAEDKLFPVGAKFLSAIIQYGRIVVYAAVDENAELEYRRIFSIGTGWEMEDNFLDNVEFIGTVKQDPYVWHVFVENK